MSFTVGKHVVGVWLELAAEVTDDDGDAIPAGADAV